MADATLRLLGRPSSINVKKVLWLCDELQLPIAHEPWGTGFQSTLPPGYEALNPNRLVPVIVDGDFVLWESNTICRYLAGRAGRSDLLPAEPQARARVEQWMDWQTTELNTSWRYAFLAIVRSIPAQPDPQAIAASIAAWNRHMEILERQLDRTGAFAAGPEFTLADIALGVSTHRWVATPIEPRASLPAVQAYYTRLSERPAFVRHVRNSTP
ncbi:MAG TPA: glutathione S-transferase [Caldimonas sp.]|jgi:glutathione S-transferase|nr:glutathione S-transferase [Caldimonas sp.]HEX4236049.1 glutathione S-transferase [Caldimonas sp.]